MTLDENDNAILSERVWELLNETAELKKESKQLKVKVAELLEGNDFLTEAIEIQKTKSSEAARIAREIKKAKKI